MTPRRFHRRHAVLGFVATLAVGSAVPRSATAQSTPRPAGEDPPATPVDIPVSPPLSVVLAPAPRTDPQIAGHPDWLARNRQTMLDRAAELGIDGITIETKPPDRLVLVLPPLDDPERVIGALLVAGLLEIIDARGDRLYPGTIVSTSLGPPSEEPANSTVYPSIVSGEDFQVVYPTEGQFGQTVLGFELRPEAADRFYDFTSNNIGRPMAILVDKQVISVPTINGAISGQGIIEGISAGEVKDLVAIPRGGILAVPMVVESARATTLPATPTPRA